MNFDRFKTLENSLLNDFLQLKSIQEDLILKLQSYSDGKTLKGNEIVGWLGEIYTKLIFNGVLVDDTCEHDVETVDGLRISVKTRKGRNSGWNKTSAIPKIDGTDSPTHLVFLNLRDNFMVNKVWSFTWDELYKNGRFKKHFVRNNLRSYYISINEKKDINNLIYEYTDNR